MLEKQQFLIQYLSKKQGNYFDNFRNDFLFLIESEDIELHFLEKLNSEQEIIDWVENSLSVYYLKYENELSLKDFFMEKVFKFEKQIKIRF